LFSPFKPADLPRIPPANAFLPSALRGRTYKDFLREPKKIGGKADKYDERFNIQKGKPAFRTGWKERVTI
jgi:hypothetical protein